ncbi:MAG: murein biosynthesis integral membrane protein MurJ [candidate division Zixibacteria bacterium]|nr:murein biosynthesis integral membrane protein MurJ [candidate division Zixibacteria bacterium]
MKSIVREESLVKSTSKVSLATFLSRLLGLVREQVTAYLFGAGDAVDAFKSAFRIPNLLRDLFAEGALSAGFVPIFSEKLKVSGKEAAIRFAGLVFGALTASLALVILLMIIFTPQIAQVIAGGFESISGKLEETVLLGRVMMPFLMLISLSALLMGTLNSFGRFGIPALAPAMLNLGMILAAVALSPYLQPPILSLALGVLLGGVGQFVLQYVYLYKLGFRLRPIFDLFNPDLMRMILLILPMTVGLAANQINIAVITRIASADSGAVSYLDYAFRLLHLPLGLFAVAIATVALPRLSGRAAAGDTAQFGQIHTRGLRLGLFLSLPAMVVMVLLANEICSVVYQYGQFSADDASQTGYVLALYSLGLPFFTLARITVPAFYAQKDTKTPALISMISVAVNVILCLELRRYLGFSGLALAAALAGIVNMTLLTFLLRRRIKIAEDRDTLRVLVKLTLAALTAGAVVWLVRPLLVDYLPTVGPNNLGVLLALLLTVGLVYLLMCRLLRVEELSEFAKVIGMKSK